MALRRDHGFQRTIDDAWAAIERGDVERARALVLGLPKPRRREAGRALIERRKNHGSPLAPRDPEVVLDLFGQAHLEAVSLISAYTQGALTISPAGYDGGPSTATRS